MKKRRKKKQRVNCRTKQLEVQIRTIYTSSENVLELVPESENPRGEGTRLSKSLSDVNLCHLVRNDSSTFFISREELNRVQKRVLRFTRLR